ncbi:uncharacterized protein LOC111378649, partial [Olea europaea var. sylvestris]|uniref:uncharacterized protein LOC111378649 n=1 Tax=Olea europaea var. sylvestris TaxID=158386 RepID=UPI000C1CEA39
ILINGKFLELLLFLANHNNDINNVVLENAPKNLQVTAHDIQREIVNTVASETTRAIINVLGDDLFSILIDESCDVSVKEQMAILLCYVNEEGSIIEWFLRIVRVNDTTALSLKFAIIHCFRSMDLVCQDYVVKTMMKLRKDILREAQAVKVVVGLTEVVAIDGKSFEQKGGAYDLLSSIQSFKFIFNMHLIKNVLGITNELSQALRRKDQDVVNAMKLVILSKQRLQ